MTARPIPGPAARDPAAAAATLAGPRAGVHGSAPARDPDPVKESPWISTPCSVTMPMAC